MPKERTTKTLYVYCTIFQKRRTHFVLRAISDTKKCKLVFAPDGSDVGASAIEVSVGLRLWMRCVPDRIVHPVTLKWRVGKFRFRSSQLPCRVFELPTSTCTVPVAIDRVAPFSTSVRQAIMRRIRVPRRKDTCFQFETETANPSSEKAERETLLRCTRVVFVQDGNVSVIL